MIYLFKKLIEDFFALILNGFGFKKLRTEVVKIPSSPYDPEGFNLDDLGLPPGTYTITITSISKGLKESNECDPITYSVK